MKNGNNTQPSINFAFKETGFVPNDTAKGLFWFLISQTLVTLFYQILYMMGFVQTIWSYVFTLILDACFVFSVYSIAKTKKLDFFDSIRAKYPPKFKEAIIALCISLVCIFGFSSITNLFMELLYSFGYTSISADIAIPNFGYYIMYVVFICVVPAISEEVLFRGLIANGLKRVSTVVAVFGSSFLFMIMHGSPDQTMHQFILGIVLALVFLISDNIWVPILVHFFNNFIAVTFAYITYDSAPIEGEVVIESAGVPLGEYLIFALISTIISVALLYLLLKALSNVKSTTKEVAEAVKKDSISPTINAFMNYSSFEYATENDPSVSAETIGRVGQEAEIPSGVVLDPPNKVSGSGRAMYVISVVWLVFDWISAFLVGISQM